MLEKLVIATRQSPLALWQANTVKQQLEHHHPTLCVELLPLTTKGDQLLDRPLAQIGGKGLFLKELEQALLDGRADIAVHSMKDVPVTLPNGCVIQSILPRGNPFDVFISHKYTHLHELPKGACIGTTSLRRQSQLFSQNSALDLRALRGNINTRLAKLETGEFDAIILAAAGIERLQIKTPHTFTFTPDIMLPACGQGIIGIETCVNNTQIQDYLAPLHHTPTATVLAAERAISKGLNGGCSAPIGAYAQLNSEEQLHVQGRVCSPDGKIVLTETRQGPAADAHDLGVQIAEALLNKGAREILAELCS